MLIISFLHAHKGMRFIPFDEKTGQFGTDFELYSLKTGQLCYKHTIFQSLIDVTKGGRAVHVNALGEQDKKWKEWKQWFNEEAARSHKLLKEAEVSKINECVMEQLINPPSLINRLKRVTSSDRQKLINRKILLKQDMLSYKRE